MMYTATILSNFLYFIQISISIYFFFFFQAEDGIRDLTVTGVQTCALPIYILTNYDWNWSAAEKEFKRAIELKPDYATAHQWYAIHYLTATGRLEEAVQIGRASCRERV